MKNLHIKEEDVQKLNEARYGDLPLTLRKRASILYYKALNYKNNKIETLADVSSTTITTVLRMYKESGIKKVLTSNYKPKRSALEAYKDEISLELEKNPPSTLKEASHQIFQLTGLLRSRYSLSVFLKKLNFKSLKTGSLPAKADSSFQEEFKKKNLSQF